VRLHFTFSIKISTRRDYSDFHSRIQSIIERNVLTVAFLSAKSWRALTRVFLERRGLIAIDELVIFLDPPFPTSALSYGKEEAAATTGGSSLHRLRRKSLFSLLTIPPRVVSDLAGRLFRARRRPRDPMPRGHVGAHPAHSPLILASFSYALSS